MRLELQRVRIWSVTKVAFFLNVIGGLVAGVFFAMMSGLIVAVEEQLSLGYESAYSADAFSIGMMLLVFPIVFAVGGAVFGTIGAIVLAFVYNTIARLTGGIELDLAEIVEATSPESMPRPITSEVSRPTRSSSPPPPPPLPSADPSPQTAPPRIEADIPTDRPSDTDDRPPKTDRLEP